MDLTRCAAAQAGVFSRAQARTAGYSSSAIDRLLWSGQWIRIGSRGVYAHAATTLVPRSWQWYAVLALGPPCALAVTTAAALWGWVDPDRATIEAAVPRERRIVDLPRVRVRRLLLPRSALTSRHGLPLTTRERTLADCLRFTTAREAIGVLDRAQQVSRVNLDAVAAHLPSRGPGTARARRLLGAALGEHSTAERLATTLLRRAGLQGWLPNYRLVLDGLTLLIDIAFPRAKVAIEIDGWAFHIDATTFQRDRERQNLLVRHGWRVLRFTYRDLVEHPERVLEQIRTAVESSPR